MAKMTPVEGQDEVSANEKRFSPSSERDGKFASKGKKRTRTGCLNCRRKRRKCDETKPTCEGCRGRRQKCEWGVRVSFRPENAQTMDVEHPSMRQSSICLRPQAFQIVDVTSEVVRDYFEEAINGEPTDFRLEGMAPVQPPRPHIPPPLQSIGQVRTSFSSSHPGPPRLRAGSSTETSPVAIRIPFQTTPDSLFLSPQMSDATLEDGIFLPGSQYQELHAALRSRLIDTARSTVPSRIGSPEPGEEPLQHAQYEHLTPVVSDDDESRQLAHMSPEQEFFLWQNYIGEVASWLDKFDKNRHFELVLPMLAKSHSHLRYSILALSARQMERQKQQSDYSCSLALYQHAIHLLSPLLHKRTTVVLASCIVLAVLEMLSCSPKAWRRHLDGCAALIQALGISGSCGSSLEQALFWCFARMDICGGLISSEKTLIPISSWLGGPDVVADITLLQMPGRFDMYANHVVYLCGQVVDLLCSSGKWEQRSQRRSDVLDVLNYNSVWTQLFDFIEWWYLNRPEEMKPILTIPAQSTNQTKPFTTLLFGNGPAVSGNQMYHTAALLMLKYKPSNVQFSPKPPSILWHARQICSISMSNNHHGCWTNSIQPLWIAGQHMSHPSEHKAILELMQHIEHETGWATKWRQDDLKDYWGNLDESV